MCMSYTKFKCVDETVPLTKVLSHRYELGGREGDAEFQNHRYDRVKVAGRR